MQKTLETLLGTIVQKYGDRINADILLNELMINECLKRNESDIVLAETTSSGKLIVSGYF